MSTSPIDLDDLARAYRHRRMGDGGRQRARASAGGLTGLAIDVGGGTGDHALELTQAGLDVLLVDISTTMCSVASSRGIEVVRARSEDLPIRDDAAALAYFHLSIHYGDWESSIDEAMRIVSPGGRIEIWSFSAAGIAHSSLARWFPSVTAIDSARFPAPDRIAERLAAGTCDVVIERHDEHVTRLAGDWMVAARNRFVSTLQLIPPDELASGLDAFRSAYPDEDALYRYTLEFQRISATV